MTPVPEGIKMAASPDEKSREGRFGESIQNRLILLLLVLLVPILFIQAYNYHRLFETRRAEELQANLEIARAAAKTFEAFVMDIVHSELVISQALTTPSISEQDRLRILDEFRADNPVVTSSYWMDPNGFVIAASPRGSIGYDLSDRSFSREVVAGRTWSISDLIVGRVTKRPTFTISRGILNERGELLGVVAAAIEPERLLEVLRIERSRAGGVSLLDSKGMLVYRFPVTQYTWEQRDWLSSYPAIKDALESKEVVASAVSNAFEIRRFVAFTPISGIGWVAAASREEDAALSAIWASLLPEAAIFVLIAIAALVGAIMLSHFITAPIRELRGHALALGEGNANFPVSVTGPAEIRDLAGGFNIMARELRAREMNLKESEEKYRALFDNMNEIMEIDELIYDEHAIPCDWRILDVNPAYLRKSGKSRDELIGWRFSELYGAHAPGPFLDRVADLVKTGEPVRFEQIFEPLQIHIRVSAFHLGGTRFATITSDITKRKQAEEILRTTVQRFHNILSNIFVGILVIDEDDQIEFVNQNFCDQFNLSEAPSELIGLPAAEILPKASTAYANPEEGMARVRQIISRGQRVEDEEILMYNGRVFLRDFIPILVDGKPRGRMWQHRDISERKLVEIELRKSHDELELRVRARTAELEKVNEELVKEIDERKRAEEGVEAERQRFYNVLESLPVYICLITQDYHVPFANRKFREYFGEPLGRRCHEFIFGKPQPCEFCQTFKVFETNEPRHWECIDPGDCNLDIYDMPFTDIDGSPLILKMEIDITERRRAEEKLKAYTARLESLNNELQDFAFIASHDLQEPLRKIQTFGNILVMKHGDSLNSEGKEHLKRMTNAANRMSNLLRSLLNYSKTGTSQLDLRPVDLTQVVKDAASDLEILVMNAGGRVEVSNLPTVEADAPLLRQLFQNLIENSMKYRKEADPPVVKISGSLSDKSCRVVIEDNGIGFREEFIHKIFMPFERLHGKDAPYKGMGMGLAICRKIAARHGGGISATSTLGRGSTFIVTLPAKH